MQVVVRGEVVKRRSLITLLSEARELVWHCLCWRPCPALPALSSSVFPPRPLL